MSTPRKLIHAFTGLVLGLALLAAQRDPAPPTRVHAGVAPLSTPGDARLEGLAQLPGPAPTAPETEAEPASRPTTTTLALAPTTTAPPAPPTTVQQPGDPWSCGGDLPPCRTLDRENPNRDLAVYNRGCHHPVGYTGTNNPCDGHTASTASGKWQFLRSTWNMFGGYVNAADAPWQVQDEKARLLWDGGRGCSHWAVC